MDMNINLNDYDLIAPTSIENIIDDEQLFIDIDVADDHTFFFKAGDTYILSHNCDGTHIAGIYMGWWLRFAPTLFNQHRIARLMTPYVILWSDNKMTKIHKSFFTMQAFKDYESKHDISKYKKNLYKGLGSWSKEQFQQLFEASPNGIKDFLQYIVLDEDGKIHVDNWLKGDSAEERKTYLRQYSLDIDKV